MTLLHPDTDQITLPTVLAALGDETRLAIVGYLARQETVGCFGVTCGQFSDITSKTNLTYHVAKLREAGVVNVLPEGTRRLISLRRADLDQLFPGFLDTIIASAVALPLVDLAMSMQDA